jgi:hypothetical protein
MLVFSESQLVQRGVSNRWLRRSNGFPGHTGRAGRIDDMTPPVAFG